MNSLLLIAHSASAVPKGGLLTRGSATENQIEIPDPRPEPAKWFSSSRFSRGVEQYASGQISEHVLYRKLSSRGFGSIYCFSNLTPE